MIEQTRLLTLHAAHALDTAGSKAARKQVLLGNSHVLCPNSILYNIVYTIY